MRDLFAIAKFLFHTKPYDNMPTGMGPGLFYMALKNLGFLGFLKT